MRDDGFIMYHLKKAMMMIINKERDATVWIFDQIPRILQKIFAQVNK